MTQSVALVVIYNHKYDRNIDIVERIYGARFSNIFHLVPFYTGTKKNVVAVYENSYYFHGYVAQGYRHFRGDYRHYFFIADDMILNPIIDETNYAALFKLDDDAGFIPELDPMPAPAWPHNRSAVTFDPFKPGVEVRNELPTADEARAVVSKLGVVNGAYPLKRTYFWNDDFSAKNIVRQTIRYAYDKFLLKTAYDRSKYPFVRSYSDIFIVPSKQADTCFHYFGVFAATDLWVELAIPTAMALSVQRIVVQSQLQFQGRPLWSAEDYRLFERFGYRLKALLENFPEDYIYLHPVKLSKWDVETR